MVSWTIVCLEGSRFGSATCTFGRRLYIDDTFRLRIIAFTIASGRQTGRWMRGRVEAQGRRAVDSGISGKS